MKIGPERTVELEVRRFPNLGIGCDRNRKDEQQREPHGTSGARIARPLAPVLERIGVAAALPRRWRFAEQRPEFTRQVRVDGLEGGAGHAEK
jgi:hypothetical protein